MILTYKISIIVYFHVPLYNGLNTNTHNIIQITKPIESNAISLLSYLVRVLSNCAIFPEKFIFLSTDPIFYLTFYIRFDWLDIDYRTPLAIYVVYLAAEWLLRRLC
jgi:hypothetical protein